MPEDVTVINTDEMTAPKAGNNLWENRAYVYNNVKEKTVPLVSIVVQAYNRLDKTKYCVECILKYTQGIDYELILVDNGSTDGTLEYFKSVDYPQKRICRLTKNIGAAYPYEWIRRIYRGKYLATIANDVYVTKNWLSNLLNCYESDAKIGLAVPMCNNTSNLQAPSNFEYSSMDEMQKKAAAFNAPDPSKWQERLRLITLAPIYKREIFDEVGFFDNGYEHNFSDDDISVRIRRAGYKLIVCGDTFVCHDHSRVVSSQKEADKINASLAKDRKAFKEKFHGIDAWEDINNFEKNLLDTLECGEYKNNDCINLLGIDTRCGTPIAEIRNRLRKERINAKVTSFAFTTRAKYYEDLLTIAEHVSCDRADFIQDFVTNNSMDVILLGEPLNNYHEPIRFLQKLFGFLKEGGTLLFKVKNAENMQTFLRMIGVDIESDGEMSAQLLPEEVKQCLHLFGASNINCIKEISPMSQQNIEALSQLVAFGTESKQFNVMKDKFETKQYLFHAEK